MININCKAQTFLMQIMLPILAKREKRSAQIDLSSECGLWPQARVPIYSASKAYNWALSEATRKAYEHKIDFLVVTPGPVRTNMNAGLNLFSADAEPHGRTVINHLGWYNDTRGHWIHGIEPYLMAITPFGMAVEAYNRRQH